MQRNLTTVVILTLLTAFSGCSEPTVPIANSPDSAASFSSPTSEVTAESPAATAASGAVEKPAAAEPEMDFKPLSASALPSSGTSSATGAATNATSKLAVEAQIKVIMETLKPLQVMLGQWRGTTRREYEGFKAVDNHEWIWDLKTVPAQPALVLKSDKSPYLRAARLTWNVQTSLFELTATDSEGVTRTYTGDYTDPVHEIVGPDDKMHRVFRIELTQTDESATAVGGERWQVAFVQQENNRYLLETARRRGTAAFVRYDTVSTQREGTSFAVSDSDYGEKTCVISQGLGTTAVSYKGKTYWVCCSGCKAAFEEDPETWIARAAARDKK